MAICWHRLRNLQNVTAKRAKFCSIYKQRLSDDQNWSHRTRSQSSTNLSVRPSFNKKLQILFIHNQVNALSVCWFGQHSKYLIYVDAHKTSD